jgi:gas vesicle protein
MSRFLLGFAIGFAIGAAAVIVTSPRPGSALRHGIGETLRATLDAARQASAAHEQELWAEFRARLTRQS